MSIKRMVAVWDKSAQKGSPLLVMLSLADRADDDGYCWPGFKDTAKRTRLSERQVMRIIRRLEALFEIYIHERIGKTHQYIVLPGLTTREIRKALRFRFDLPDEEIDQYLEAKKLFKTAGDKKSPPTTCQGGG